MDQVNQNATFDHDDVFERKKYMTRAMTLIDNYPAERGACTIAIDAPWGVGKSTFLHMWRNALRCYTPDYVKRNGEHHLKLCTVQERSAVYYNAWEHEDDSDAFSPLLWTIISTLVADRYHDGINISKDAILTAVGSVATLYATAKPEDWKAAIVSPAINSAKSIWQQLKDTPSDNIVNAIMQQQRKQQKDRADLIHYITDLAAACGKLIIFIDELDRCNPQFVTHTLSAIKNYLDVPNLVFVFGVDLTQLTNAISGLYSGLMDPGGYLTKYFDYPLRLPTPTSKQMIQMVFQNYSMSPRQEETVELIFQACDVTPRETPRIYHSVNALQDQINKYGWTYEERVIMTLCLILFMSMKHRKPDVYASYLSGNSRWDKYGWQNGFPRIYTFLKSLSVFLTMSPASCYEEWRTMTEADTSSIEQPILDTIVFFGQKALSYSRSDLNMTFGQALQKLLESVIV